MDHIFHSEFSCFFNRIRVPSRVMDFITEETGVTFIAVMFFVPIGNAFYSDVQENGNVRIHRPSHGCRKERRSRKNPHIELYGH